MIDVWCYQQSTQFHDGWCLWATISQHHNNTCSAPLIFLSQLPSPKPNDVMKGGRPSEF